MAFYCAKSVIALAQEVDANRCRLGAADCIKLQVAAMQAHPANCDLIIRTVDALSRLALAEGSQDNRRQLRMAGAPTTIVVTLRTNLADVHCVTQCLRAIFDFAATAPRSENNLALAAGTDRLITALAEAGACEAIVEPLDAHPDAPLVLENAMFTIHSMSADTACKTRFGAAGAAKFVVHAMHSQTAPFLTLRPVSWPPSV